jgi:hypothetical protein
MGRETIRGVKYQKNTADGIESKRRRQRRKETAAKPWIADGKFENTESG